MLKPDRLFVPLSSEPYSWFKQGLKKWELRKYGGYFTERNVRQGRKVELRCGYKDPARSIWGEIGTVVVAHGLHDFFERVPYEQVIPIAENRAEATALAQQRLRLDPRHPTRVLGFEVTLDRQKTMGQARE